MLDIHGDKRYSKIDERPFTSTDGQLGGGSKLVRAIIVAVSDIMLCLVVSIDERGRNSAACMSRFLPRCLS